MLEAWAYARFCFINAFQLATVCFLLLGGSWLWAGLALAVVFVLLDEVFEDRSEPSYRYPWLLNFLLYFNLPTLLFLSVVYAFHLSDADPLGLASIAEQILGIDLEAARASTSAFELVGAGLVVALFYGAAGINVAHELAHRTHSAVDQAVARWMLAFTFDTTFPIEHVNGHHRHVATKRDPASARRGEYIGAFILRSTIGCFTNAFKIEANRLEALGKSSWSLSNRALRGQAMSLVYVAGYYWLAGWTGVAVFLALAANGKAYLEAVNYIEHYGLVRVPGRPVEPRHSWDCYRSISTTFLYNLTRHSDHHVHSRKPYWGNRVEAGAPLMPSGYMLMILCAFVPPLWRRIANPRLADWDAKMASEAERELVRMRGWSIDRAA